MPSRSQRLRTAFVVVGKQLPHELMTFEKHGSARHVSCAILEAAAKPVASNPAITISRIDAAALHCITAIYWAPLCTLPSRISRCGIKQCTQHKQTDRVGTNEEPTRAQRVPSALQILQSPTRGNFTSSIQPEPPSATTQSTLTQIDYRSRCWFARHT